MTGQVLKIIAARPDAVMTGGSGTPGALPYLALAERGFKGNVYGQHGLINPDFVRVAGAAANGSFMPTGPVIVAEQLPDDYPTKKSRSISAPPSRRSTTRRAPTRSRPIRSTATWCSPMRRRARLPRASRARRRSARRCATRSSARRRWRDARRLQLQAGRPVRRGRAGARDREARERAVEAGP